MKMQLILHNRCEKNLRLYHLPASTIVYIEDSVNWLSYIQTILFVLRFPELRLRSKWFRRLNG